MVMEEGSCRGFGVLASLFVISSLSHHSPQLERVFQFGDDGLGLGAGWRGGRGDGRDAAASERERDSEPRLRKKTENGREGAAPPLLCLHAPSTPLISSLTMQSSSGLPPTGTAGRGLAGAAKESLKGLGALASPPAGGSPSAMALTERVRERARCECVCLERVRVWDSRPGSHTHSLGHSVAR